MTRFHAALARACATYPLQDAIEYSADVLHARDQYSMTAVMHAVASYQHECVELILHHSVGDDGNLSVRQQTDRGNTALHFAYETGDEHMVKILLKYVLCHASRCPVASLCCIGRRCTLRL